MLPVSLVAGELPGQKPRTQNPERHGSMYRMGMGFLPGCDVITNLTGMVNEMIISKVS